MADFLDEAFPEPEADEAVNPVVEAPVETADPVMEAPVEVENEPAPVVEQEAPKEDSRAIPLATFLDQRDELRRIKREKEELEARMRQQPDPIDPFDDPAGFAARQQEMVEQRLMQERFAFSDRFARKEHGAEAVEKAVEWAQQRASSDPAFAMSYMRESDPIDWIVQQHKREALLSDIGDNVDDWFVREAAKRGYALPSAAHAAAEIPVAATQPAQRPAAPPRSIAADSGKGSVAQANDARAEFLSIFAKG